MEYGMSSLGTLQVVMAETAECERLLFCYKESCTHHANSLGPNHFNKDLNVDYDI